MIYSRIFLLFLLFFYVSAHGQVKNDRWLQELLESKGTPLLRHVLSNADSFQYQVIYTQINRDKHNKPHFRNYYVNVDRGRYFNPASTVKLPTALAALEKINKLKQKGIDKNTSMLTDSSYPGQTSVLKDTSSVNGLPSVAQYIKKIFLVSDNDAYNRLYEFTGQEELNQALRNKGYKDVRITRRFVPMNEEENRHTNATRFIKDGKLIYEQPAAYSHFKFDFSKTILIGNAHYNWQDSLIPTPMDFTTHNNLPLEDLQQLLRSVMFPYSLPRKKRFNLTEEDLAFLHQYMSAYPSQSHFPAYDTTEYFDSYAKFFYKAAKTKPPSYIHIYNKPGWSFGFLTDAAYVTDSLNGVEFMLCAVIYVNRDGILNDDKYEYNEVGYPFFNDLYHVIYNMEKERKRKYIPFFPIESATHNHFDRAVF
jgi:hypothetical protein